MLLFLFTKNVSFKNLNHSMLYFTKLLPLDWLIIVIAPQGTEHRMLGLQIKTLYNKYILLNRILSFIFWKIIRIIRGEDSSNQACL